MSANHESNQQEQIGKLVDEAIAKGLVEQATSMELPGEARDEFTRIMLERIESEIRQAQIDAGVQKEYEHLGAAEFLDQFRDKLCKTICDQNGGLKEKYHNVATLGGDAKKKLLIELVEEILSLLLPLYKIYTLAVKLVLYALRVGLDKWCKSV